MTKVDSHRYPALAAYNAAYAAWQAGPVGDDGLLVGDGPEFTKAAERDLERKRQDDKARFKAYAEAERAAGAEDGSWAGGW